MIDYTHRARTTRPTVVNVNHPNRAPQTLRAPSDTSIRLLAGQSTRLV